MIKNSDHPWGAFLYARARVLRWLRDEMGESPEVTCQTMAMDPGQVRLILDTPIEEPTPVQSTDQGQEKT